MNYQILEILKQRRIWAGIFGAIAFILPMFGVSLALDVNGITDAIMVLIQAISGIVAVAFPIISYFKPKQ